MLKSHHAEKSAKESGLRWRTLAAVGSLAAVAAIAFGVGRDVQKYEDTGHAAERTTFNPLTWIEAPAANWIIGIEGGAQYTPPVFKKGNHERS